jgi:hypothetical protein
MLTSGSQNKTRLQYRILKIRKLCNAKKTNKI